jgi:hypothetical protein
MFFVLKYKNIKKNRQGRQSWYIESALKWFIDIIIDDERHYLIYQIGWADNLKAYVLP